MNHVVLLDTGVLSLVTNPKHSSEPMDCSQWLESLLMVDCSVYIPEICDYELRRELIRANRREGLQRLDDLKNTLEYLPITTSVMNMAADFWARARNMRRQATDDKALDADMILVAQATESSLGSAIIATTNVKHLSLFATARLWRDIASDM